MGFFNKLFNGTIELSKISKSAFLIDSLLDDIKNNDFASFQEWLEIAWICRVGIIDRIEKNNLQLDHSIVFQFPEGVKRITILETYSLTVGRLIEMSKDLNIPQISEAIIEVLEKKETFYIVDNEIDFRLKEELEKFI